MNLVPRQFRSLTSSVVIVLAVFAITTAAVFAQSTFPGIEGKLWKQLLPWGENVDANGAVIWADPTDLNNVPSSLRVDTGDLDHLGNVIYQSTLPPNAPPGAQLYGWSTMQSSFDAAELQFGALTATGQCTFSHQADYDLDSTIYWPQVRWCRGPIVDNTNPSAPVYAKLPPPSGRLLNPVGLAIDGSRVYVSDLFNHRIQVFDFFGNVQTMAFPIGNGEPASGTYDYDVRYPGLNFRAFPSISTSGRGQRLNAPSGLALDGTQGQAAARKLLVADSFNHRIAIFTTATATSGSPAFGTFAAPIHGALPVPVDGNGNRIVPIDEDGVESGNGEVVPDQVAITPGASVLQPNPAVGSGTADRVVVTDRRHCYVLIMDTAFKLIKSLPATRPAQIQHDACQDPELGPTQPGEFSTVTAVKIDEFNRIYVADHSQNQIQVFDNNGNFLARIGHPGDGNPVTPNGDLSGPVGLFFDKYTFNGQPVRRLGVIDAGHARAVFYGIDNGPAAATYQFEVPTTVAVDDFPMGIEVQRGPAPGLDPKGRILVTDPYKRRVLRFELPELVIVNQRADTGTLSGAFDVVVPRQKTATVVGVTTTIDPIESGVTVTSHSPSAPVNIAPGGIQHYTFPFTMQPSTTTATFDINATGDGGLTKAPQVSAAAYTTCTIQECGAQHTIYYDPPSDPDNPTLAVPYIKPNAEQWYGHEVFVRIVPTGNTPATHIRWRRGGQAAIDYDGDDHEELIGDDGRVDVLFRTSGKHTLYYRAIGPAGITDEVAVPVFVDLAPPEGNYLSWKINGVDVTPVVDPVGRPWYRTIAGPLVGTYQVTDLHSGVKIPASATGTVSFALEGRDLTVDTSTSDYVTNTASFNSRFSTNGRWVNIDNTAPVIAAAAEYTVTATGNDANGMFATLSAGAIQANVTDPLLADGSPGSRPNPFTVDSPAGTFRDNQIITFTATDYAGNTSTKTARIRVMNTPIVTYLSQPTVVYGSTLLMKAQVTPVYATGTVQFTIDGRTVVGTLVDETVGSVTRRVANVTLPNVFSNVGTYSVALAYSGDSQLPAVLGTGEVRVLPYPVVVTADNKSKYYGAPDPVLTYTSVPDAAHLLRPTDAFVGTIGRVSGPAVGTYEIQKYQLALNNPNYDLIFNNGTFTIIGLVTVNPRPVTLTFGQADPATWAFDFGAFPDGSSISNVTTQPTCSAPGPRTAGIFNIIQCAGGTGNLIEFAYNKANLTILKADPVMTITGGTFTYDGVAHPATCTVKGGDGATLVGAVTYAGGSVPVNAGTVLATCTFAGDANNNPITKTANVVINRRPITVKGGTFSILLGAVEPNLACNLSSTTTSTAACSITAGSLVSGHTISGVLTRQAGTTVGAYPILQGTAAVVTYGANYDLTYVNGVLNILPLPVNNPPDAKDDNATTSGAAPVDITVLGNDTDPDGNTLTVTAFTQPSTGGVVTQSGSLLKFTPTPGFSGTVTFTYTISDGNGGTDTATVTVVVTQASCTTNGFTTYTQGGWGASPNGNNPAALLASKFAQVYPSGYVRIGGTKTLTFTTAAAIHAFLPAGGTPSMLSASATNPTSSSAGVLAGQVLALQLNVDFSRAGVTKTGLGDLLYQGYPVSVVLDAANQVLGGNTSVLDAVGLNISDLNAIVDSINNNFDNGSVNLGALTCPSGTCNAGTIVLNDGSSATSGTAGNIRSFTGNGVNVKVSAFSRAKSNGAWSTAFLGSYGSAGLGVTDASEGTGAYNQHKVDNMGDRLNYMLFEFSKPVVVTKAWLDYIGADSDATIWVGNKTTDPYNNHLTLSDALLASLGTPQSSTATSTEDRWATFNGDAVAVNVVVIAADVNDTTPEDEFKVSKIDITCASAPVNRPPTLTLANRTNFKKTAVSVQVAGDDPDGDTLTYTATGLPTGTSMNAAGLITGTVTTTGTYNVTVTAKDPSNATASATFVWTVTNRAPTVAPANRTDSKGASVSVQITGSDADGDTMTYSATGLPPGATMNSSGLITGTLTTAGIYTVTVTVKDVENVTGTGTFTWTVNAANRPPDAKNDTSSTTKNTQKVITVLTNDVDPDGNTLTVTSVTQPSKGTVTKNSNGTLTFKPASNFVGTTTFTYTVSDGKGGTDTATVTVTVTSHNDNDGCNGDHDHNGTRDRHDYEEEDCDRNHRHSSSCDRHR